VYQILGEKKSSVLERMKTNVKFMVANRVDAKL